MKEEAILYPWLNVKTAPISDIVNALLEKLSSNRRLAYGLSLVAAYPIIVSLLRFRRLKSLHARYYFPTRASLANMTLQQAWEIQKEMAQLEFPMMYLKALQFALFRVSVASLDLGFILIYAMAF